MKKRANYSRRKLTATSLDTICVSRKTRGFRAGSVCFHDSPANPSFFFRGLRLVPASVRGRSENQSLFNYLGSYAKQIRSPGEKIEGPLIIA